tara:strand:+ start:28019 stop:31288 length:3270 start_codon:yes stop_codon:yes gene_type:complete
MTDHYTHFESEWINASAGSGKTYQLIQRILKLILADVPYGNILCITFTNAAAREMEKRLHEKLQGWALSNDGDLEKELGALGFTGSDINLLSKAKNIYTNYLWSETKIRFTTLHGLCQSFLRTFAIESDLSPNFTVLEENEQNNLWQKSFEKIAEKHETKSILSKLVDYTTLFNLQDLLQTILKNRHRWVKSCTLKNETSTSLNQLSQNAESQNFDNSLGWLIKKHPLESVLELCERARNLSDSDQLFVENLAVFYRNFCNTPSKPSWQALSSLFLTQSNKPRKKLLSKKAFESLADKEKSFLELSDDIWHVHQIGLIEKIWNKTTLLVEIFTLVFNEYEHKKNSFGLLDFDDLIIKTTQLLQSQEQGAWVRYKLDNQLSHILVDEAQDTSSHQWQLIINLIDDFFSKDNSDTTKSFFVVGDQKQSIYSFQGAKLAEFDLFRSQIYKKFINHKNPIIERSLSHSYRSTTPILSFIDEVFKVHKNPISPFYKATHSSQRINNYGKVSVWPLIHQNESCNDSEAMAGTEEKLAEKLAQKIRLWLDQGKLLQTKERPIHAGDIMILIQKRGRFGPAMANALKKYQIPCAGLDRLTLQDDLAVRDLHSLLKFLLLPEDDFSLASILKSSLIKIDEKTLFKLCIAREEKSLWQELKDQSNYNEKLKEIVLWLQELLNKVDYNTPQDLISTILIEQKGMKKWIDDLGSNATDPLLEYLTLAEQHQIKNGPSLEHWVHWFEANEIQIKRETGDANQKYVRLLTVHGAKGLQAPIVFLPDTTETKIDKGPLYWSKGGLFWASSSTEKGFEPIKSIKDHTQNDLEDESNRLLYVALTRAEEELYICGWEPNRGEVSDNSWYKKCHKAISQLKSKSDRNKETIVYEPFPPKKINKDFTISDIKFGKIIYSPDLFNPLDTKRESTKILRPSGDEEEDNNTLKNERALFYGSLMHKILEHLPHLGDKEEYLRKTKIYVESIDSEFLSHDKKSQLVNDLKNLLNSAIPEINMQGSYFSEVSFRAIEEKKIINGQIDLIVRNPKTRQIWLIDYKTGIYSEKSMEKYKKQLKIYGQFTQKQCPQDTINLALLWIDSLKLYKFKL